MNVNVHIEYLPTYKKKEWGSLTYARSGDACVDLRAAIRNSILLQKGSVHLIPTGIKVAIPEGYEIQIRPRSGFASRRGTVIINSPGTIDSGYRGEIIVALSSILYNGVEIHPGDRIAQAKLAVVPRMNFVECLDISKNLQTERGEGGFGSTDVE